MFSEGEWFNTHRYQRFNLNLKYVYASRRCVYLAVIINILKFLVVRLRSFMLFYDLFCKQIVYLYYILTTPAKTFDLPPPRDHKHIQKQRGLQRSPRGAPLQAHPVKSCYLPPP